MTDLYGDSVNEPDQYTHYAWTDAGCEPKNPGGTGAIGLILRDSAGKTLFSDSLIIGSGPGISNNMAEHYAMAEILAYIYWQCKKGDCVLIRTDSMLVAKQLCQRWKAKRGLYVKQYNRGLKNLNACIEIGIDIDICWVPREQNTEADDLVRQAFALAGVSPTKYKKKKVKK